MQGEKADLHGTAGGLWQGLVSDNLQEGKELSAVTEVACNVFNFHVALAEVAVDPCGERLCLLTLPLIAELRGLWLTIRHR